MTEIGIAGAVLGGVLSLISPCSALLLPSFFAYAFGTRRRLLARTAVFYLGLAAILVPLGAGIGAMGSLLTVHRTTVTMVGGVVIIVLGVVIMVGGGFALPGASGRMGRLRLDSWLSVAALGMLYGLAGFCAGPLLGGVLTVALAGGSATYGGILMASYAAGMAVPLFVLALVWDKFDLGRRSWIRGRAISIGRWRTHTTSLVSGVLFVGIGVLFLTTAGTATLGLGMGVDAQFELQSWLKSAAGAVSDVTVLFWIAVAVAVGIGIRIAVTWRRGASAE